MKRLAFAVCLVACCATSALFGAETKKIVLIAGAASHGHGEHAHPAGCTLLKACLDTLPGITTVVCTDGWPQNPEATFADAATVVIYSDGGGGHPFLRGNRLETIRALMNKGVGLGLIHYAVEATKEKGEKEFLDWAGGCFEVNWSVNPSWDADFKEFPQHPITRGLKPFKLHDEWYFYMRFREGMQGVTPVLSAVAPSGTMSRPDGPHEGNPAVRASVQRGDAQHMAWAAERPDGGRGFGFTGGHFYKNWGDDNFRKVVLNAILWTAKVEVPPEGVQSRVTPEELKKTLDAKY